MRIADFWEIFKMLFKRFRRKKIQKSKPYLVILDPGHGGGKTGAISRDGAVKEKDVVLNIAQMIVERAESLGDLPFEIHLTRQTDVHVSLSARCGYANKTFVHYNFGKETGTVRAYRKAVFVSIHCNARHPTGKHGLEIETFFHSLSMNSIALAGTMLNSLIDYARMFVLPVFNRGAKVGKTWSSRLQRMVYYYVIKHTVMPSAILELGFLTDDEEAKLLNSHPAQIIFARAIIDGLKNYFEAKEKI